MWGRKVAFHPLPPRKGVSARTDIGDRGWAFGGLKHCCHEAKQWGCQACHLQWAILRTPHGFESRWSNDIFTNHCCMPVPCIVELRLDALKLFHGGVLPMNDTTILTGRNSSGKSNALEGREVLVRLAEGEDLIDALDARRRVGGAIHGGSAGCAPHGSDQFALGCSVEVGKEVGKDRYDYNLVVEVAPDLRIISERLTSHDAAVSNGLISEVQLIETRPIDAPGTGIEAESHTGKRGRNRWHKFRDNRLLVSQVPLIVNEVESVRLALRGVSHFEPVPHLMRDFVPGKDVELRRTGENLSAALRNLQVHDPEAFASLTDVVVKVADDRVTGVSLVSSELGHAMLTLDETRCGRRDQ